MQTTFLEHKQLAPGIMSFYFAKPAGFQYTAGQFIELTLTGHQEDGKPAKRWFTLSSSPSEDHLAITTRAGSGKHTPFKQALAKLQPGAHVDVTQPMGDFVLPKLIQTPIIYIVGGIGVTPVRSQLTWLADTGEQRPITLLIGLRNEDDIIFQDVFDRAKQHATIVVENPTAAWGGERGRLSAELILGLEKPSDDALFYLSGPEPFVLGLAKDLRAHGVAPRQIVSDEFPGYETI